MPAIESTLDAVIWLQRSAEAEATFQGIFAAAGRELERALAEPARSALGQGPEAAGLPPAVIADVDETLLDNTPFAGRMLADGTRFDKDVWVDWVKLAEARAFPGAVEFAQRAAAAGVTLFYVTNRDLGQEEGTRANLARLGFPLAADRDTVMLRGERPEWKSDKGGRREEIARTHRVLLLLGDDLNDFVSGARGASAAARAERVAGERARWGRDWFMLPNPTYGSWESAILGEERLTDEQLLERKRAAVRSFP